MKNKYSKMPLEKKKKLLESRLKKTINEMKLKEEESEFDFIAYMKDLRTFLFDMERRNPNDTDIVKIIKKLESCAKILRKEYSNGFGTPT